MYCVLLNVASWPKHVIHTKSLKKMQIFVITDSTFIYILSQWDVVNNNDIFSLNLRVVATPACA